MWCLLARLALKLYSGWFYTSLFLFFRSLSGIKLKFLASLCCSTTVIRHIWNDTSHTYNLFSWYLYWYLMYVVKQCCNYIQYYRVCTIRLYGYHYTGYFSGILLVKSVKVVVIMWIFFCFLYWWHWKHLHVREPFYINLVYF